MASIEERKRGKRKEFRVKWWKLDGRQTSKGGFRTRAAALRFQLKVEDILAEGREWEPPAPIPDVQALIQTYLDEKGVRWAPGTKKQHAIALGQLVHVLKDSGGVEPSRLTRETLSAYYRWLEARGCSPITTVQRVQKVEAFWRWLGFHPTYRDLVPAPQSLELRDVLAPRKPAATWSELDAVVSASGSWYRDLHIVLRYTGLRVGQVMKLTHADIDLDDAVLVIRPELGKSRHEKRGRIVPVSQHLVDEIAGWGVRDGFLINPTRFPDAHGPKNTKRVVHRRVLRETWERAEVRREIWDTIHREDGSKSRGQLAHAFRRGFVTGLLGLGVERHVVKILVGHHQDVTDDYTDPELLPQLRQAVDLIPAVGEANDVPLLFPRRANGSVMSSRP